MHLDVPPQIEAMIREKVESGEYLDAAQVVEEALRLLQERDDLRQLRAALQIGIDQLDRGEGVSYTPALRASIFESALRKAQEGKRPKADVLP